MAWRFYSADGRAKTVATRLLFGSGDPDDSVGYDGDAYLDTAGGGLWQKSGGTWTLKCTLVLA